MKDYHDTDAVELAAWVRNGKASPAELQQEARRLLAEKNSEFNAVIREIQTEEAYGGSPASKNGPFYGVPFLLKDLSADLAGTATGMGSRFTADYVPQKNSALVDRYLAAGLQILGKTNTPEFGLSYATEPEVHGPCRNPWNSDNSPGGSSGGSAAAVAAGIVPAAHASDGGGSIRVPAALCGLFGFKPTRGRIPVGPARGESLHGMSGSHVLSRSVRDSAALLDATHGALAGDPNIPSPPQRLYLNAVGRPPPPLRIAVSLRSAYEVSVAPAYERLVEDSVRLLESLGHRVEEAHPDIDPECYSSVSRVLFSVVTARNFEDLADRMGTPADTRSVEPFTRACIVSGRQCTALEHMAALNDMHHIGRAVGSFFTRYDVLLSPTLAQVALPIGHLGDATLSFDEVFERSRAFSPFTTVFNMSGGPAMSVPLGMASEHEPLGLQFAADFGREDLLFQLAGQLERAAPWKHRRPLPARVAAEASESP